VIFLDTNVLIAATQITHPHNPLSQDLLKRTRGVETVIAAHTLAELYSALTRIRPPERVSPQVAMQAIEVYLLRMRPIVLTTPEYVDTIRAAAGKGHGGGMIYDALLLACARKSRAERIYTWNIKHFRAIAPDLVDRIVTP
jgi:predicted nucleic acid-binding protein